MDAVLAPSRFLRDMIARTIPGLPVVHFPQGIHLPEEVRVDRERWGFGSDVTAFVCSFDLSSDLTRKNPLGVVAAFRKAFAESDAAQLVVRVNHAERADLAGDMEALNREVGGAVRLLTDPLSYDEVLSLYASADVYVSLHRAEGLGLGMLEAMALGKPVVATAYSGNMDFMDADVGMLIDYRLVAVRPSPAYDPSIIGDNQKWAEPDIDQAAAAMRRLYEDPALRQRFGAHGVARAAEVNAEHANGVVFENVCKLAESTPRSHRHYREIRSLAAPGRREAYLRHIVAGLRALKLKAPAPVDEKPPVFPMVTGPDGLCALNSSRRSE